MQETRAYAGRLLEEVSLRSRAERCRYLARYVNDIEVRQKLLAYAGELEEQAALVRMS